MSRTIVLINAQRGSLRKRQALSLPAAAQFSLMQSRSTFDSSVPFIQAVALFLTLLITKMISSGRNSVIGKDERESENTPSRRDK